MQFKFKISSFSFKRQYFWFWGKSHISILLAFSSVGGMLFVYPSIIVHVPLDFD